jgi:hypothetical protein
MMIKSWAAAALVLVPVLGVPGCGDDPLGTADPTDIASWMEFYEVPGVSVAVINDFQLDYVEVHGVKSRSTQEPVTARTRFQAASISKSVSALGVVRLAQEGVISLDGEVNHYLTSWQVPDNALQNTELAEVRNDYALGFAVWSEEGQQYFGHGGANDGFRCLMIAHRSGGYGVGVMTNSDNGSELLEAVVKLIGEREEWPGYD